MWPTLIQILQTWNTSKSLSCLSLRLLYKMIINIEDDEEGEKEEERVLVNFFYQEESLQFLFYLLTGYKGDFDSPEEKL